MHSHPNGYKGISMSHWKDMLKCYFSWRQEHQAWQTRAVFGSSYIPVILTNCLGLVVPSCRWCYTTAAELPWHLQISLLEGIRKHLSLRAGGKQDSWRGSPQPLTRRWHNVTAVWTWTISELSLSTSGELLRGELNGQALSKGCMVALRWWLLCCWSLISLPGVFFCSCKCIQGNTTLTSSLSPCVPVHAGMRTLHIHPRACMVCMGLLSLQLAWTWQACWRARSTAAHCSPRQTSNPPADACETPGADVSGTPGCQHQLLARGPPAAVVHTWSCWQSGVPGALEPHSSPSSELQGLSAHGCITPVDCWPSCGLYTLEQNCLPYFCTDRAGSELQEPGSGLGRATLLKSGDRDPGNSTAVNNSLALGLSHGCVRLPLERLEDWSSFQKWETEAHNKIWGWACRKGVQPGAGVLPLFLEQPVTIGKHVTVLWQTQLPLLCLWPNSWAHCTAWAVRTCKAVRESWMNRPVGVQSAVALRMDYFKGRAQLV